MKIIIFGATGFIGSHAAEQITKRGHQVTAPVRRNSKTDFLKGLGVTIREIDFNQLESLNTLNSYIDNDSMVINCIAYGGQQNNRKGFNEVEIELTRRIIRYLGSRKIQGYIQLSSIISYGHLLPTKPIDENFLQNPTILMDQIALEREKTVIRECSRLSIPYIIIQPASTIGPRERMSAFGRMMDYHMEEKFPILLGGEAVFSCIDTRDIGRAMEFTLNNLDKMKNRNYLLKGFEISWMEYKKALDKIQDVRKGVKKYPYRLLRVIAAVMEFFKLTPPISTRAILALAKPKLYDDSKFRSYGFNPLYSLEDAIINTLENKIK